MSMEDLNTTLIPLTSAIFICFPQELCNPHVLCVCVHKYVHGGGLDVWGQSGLRWPVNIYRMLCLHGATSWKAALTNLTTQTAAAATMTTTRQKDDPQPRVVECVAQRSAASLSSPHPRPSGSNINGNMITKDFTLLSDYVKVAMSLSCLVHDVTVFKSPPLLLLLGCLCLHVGISRQKY